MWDKANLLKLMNACRPDKRKKPVCDTFQTWSVFEMNNKGRQIRADQEKRSHQYWRSLSCFQVSFGAGAWRSTSSPCFRLQILKSRFRAKQRSAAVTEVTDESGNAVFKTTVSRLLIVLIHIGLKWKKRTWGPHISDSTFDSARLLSEQLQTCKRCWIVWHLSKLSLHVGYISFL